MSTRVAKRKAKKAKSRLEAGTQALTKSQLNYLKFFENSSTSLSPELAINTKLVENSFKIRVNPATIAVSDLMPFNSISRRWLSG